MARGMALKRNAFWAAIILLVWSIIGIGAFVAQATQDLDVLAKKDAYQAHLFAAMPGWAWAAYAVAIFAGFAGSVALILRSRWAVPLYWLSLAGIVIQFGRTFLMTDIIAVRGWGTAIFPAVITAIALFQIWLASKLRRGGNLA
ncbi:hypothetical protein BH10PSE13_BH10PSE13_13400 [soil metagenome]